MAGLEPGQALRSLYDGFLSLCCFLLPSEEGRERMRHRCAIPAHFTSLYLKLLCVF